MNPAPSTVTPPQYLTAADIGRRAGRHANTIKEIAAQLRIDLARTASGTRLFTEENAEKIVAEIQRREREANR